MSQPSDPWVYRSSGARGSYKGKHGFGHWYRDNQVYFITARCRERTPAFSSEDAKQVFWQQWDTCTRQYQFVPWVSSLLDNHYHVLGYCTRGVLLPRMMQHFHGSVAKLVNDLLPQRLAKFWTDSGRQSYFDGCIRNEKQCRLAYRYTLGQSVRHGVRCDWRMYPHTRVSVTLEDALAFAREKRAYLEGVRYRRYETHD